MFFSKCTNERAYDWRISCRVTPHTQKVFKKRKNWVQTFIRLCHKHTGLSILYLLAQGATTLSLHRLIQQNGANKSVCHCVMKEMWILTPHVHSTPTHDFSLHNFRTLVLFKTGFLCLCLVFQPAAQALKTLEQQRSHKKGSNESRQRLLEPFSKYAWNGD